MNLIIFVHEPNLFSIPLRFWLGIILATLVLTQMMIGKGILKVDFRYHRRLIPVLILIVLSFHAFLGFQAYFLK